MHAFSATDTPMRVLALIAVAWLCGTIGASATLLHPGAGHVGMRHLHAGTDSKHGSGQRPAATPIDDEQVRGGAEHGGHRIDLMPLIENNLIQ